MYNFSFLVENICEFTKVLKLVDIILYNTILKYVYRSMTTFDLDPNIEVHYSELFSNFPVGK